MAIKGKRVLILATHGFEQSELEVPFKILKEAGATVDVVEAYRTEAPAETAALIARMGKPEYVFFVDFEGHAEDPKVKKALSALQAHCEQLSILGSFPIATVSSIGPGPVDV